MKILVTGPCGFVGARIMHMTAGAIASPSLRNMDESAVRQLVESVQPELVVHTAAVSDISACDRDPEASRLFEAKVSFSPEDPEAAHALLLEELTSLYGIPEEE